MQNFGQQYSELTNKSYQVNKYTHMFFWKPLEEVNWTRYLNWFWKKQT